MKEIFCISDLAADVQYGLNIRDDAVQSRDLANLDALNSVIRSVCAAQHDSIESLVDSVAKEVNGRLRYDMRGFQSQMGHPQKIEQDPKKARIFSNEILKGSYGRCVDAGLIIRTILQDILPNEYHVEQILIDSQVYENGAHDVTLVYSPQGKVVVDSIRYEGHEGGVFSEEDCPILIKKWNDFSDDSSQ